MPLIMKQRDLFYGSKANKKMGAPLMGLKVGKKALAFARGEEEESSARMQRAQQGKSKTVKLPEPVEVFLKTLKGKGKAISPVKPKKKFVDPSPKEEPRKRKLMLQSTQTSKKTKV